MVRALSWPDLDIQAGFNGFPEDGDRQVPKTP